MDITDEMREARINCPVESCVGTVKLIAHDGDIPVWECDNCQSEWHADGTPRWTIEHVLDIEVQQ